MLSINFDTINHEKKHACYVNIRMLMSTVICELQREFRNKYIIVYYLCLEKRPLKMERVKKHYPTSAQKARLLAFIETDEELRHGKFTAKFTKKDAETRWMRVAKVLNSIPGVKKTWAEWRKCWQDMKSKRKKKNILLRRLPNSSGGGSSAPVTQQDLEILSRMSESVFTAHSDCKGSVVKFQDIDGLSEILEGFEVPLTKPEADPAASRQHKLEFVDVTDNEREIKKENTVTPKQLDKCLEIASEMKNALLDKNEIRKKFNEQYMVEMRRRTDALIRIADNLSKK